MTDSTKPRRHQAQLDQLLTTSGFAVHHVVELPGSGFSVLYGGPQPS
jgi:hypothetical protein